MDEEFGHDLRTALRAAAAPAEVSAGERAAVSDQIARARRRRATLRAVVGSAAAVVLIGTGAALLLPGPNAADPARPDGPTRPAATDGWEPMAHSPLSPRANSIGVWTGKELLVVGGETGPVCPAASRCVKPPTPSADAAAYDPDTDTWRTLPAAPAPISNGFGVWLGDRALFVADGATTALLYDPDTDTWTRAPDLPAPVWDGGLVATDAGAVRFSYAKNPTLSRPTDFAFDPVTESWTGVPNDPFAESYDRSMAWQDGRLWLLSMSVENHFDAYRGRPSRLAVLESGGWRVVDDATPALTQLQWLIPQDDLLVVAENRDPAAPNRAFDPVTESWRDVVPAQANASGCSLGNSAAGPEWITAGNRLVSAVPPAAISVPPCPDRAAFHLVTWAGESLVIWGGTPTAMSSDPTNSGLVWTPPSPPVTP